MTHQPSTPLPATMDSSIAAQPILPWWAFSEEEVIAQHATDPINGLTDAEASTRLAKYGENALPEEEKESFLASLIDALTDPLAIVLTVAAILSAGIGIAQGEPDKLQQAGWIMGIVVFMTIIGYVVDRSADNALAKLKEMQQIPAHIVRNGKRIEINAEKVVPGDVLTLKQGDRVPADARIIQATDATAGEAVLTGEPETEKHTGVLEEEALIKDRSNMLHMGTFIEGGDVRAVVTNTGMATEFGKIYKELQEAEKTDTPLQRQLEKLGNFILVGTLVICVLVVLIYVVVQKYAILDALIVAVALAIAFIPEALGAIITIALALGVREMVGKKAIIRKLYAAEGLGSVSIVCTDKTGTITFNKMTATHVWTPDTGEVRLEAAEIKNRSKEFRRLLDVARLCNNLKDGTERALGKLAEMAGFVMNEERLLSRVGLVPFNSARKMMSTLDHDGDGTHTLHAKGAPEVLLYRCATVIEGGKAIPLTDDKRKRIQVQVLRFEREGYRVLAFAEREFDVLPPEVNDSVEENLVFVGLIAISDPPRSEVKQTVQHLREAHITAKMITGDSANTALSIAREVGIVSAEATSHDVIDGVEMRRYTEKGADNLTPEELARLVKTNVYARVSPSDKVTIVRGLQRAGHLTAMTGDGVNDAASLKQADVGIAMADGTELAKEVSDVILTGTYSAIGAAVQVGRTILYRARLYIHALLSTNGSEVGAFIVAALAGFPVPLTAIQLLVINLLGDSWLSIALAAEKEEPDVMQQPPRPSTEPVITRYMWFSIGLQSIVVTILLTITFLIARNYTRSIGLADTDGVALAMQQTATFTMFMIQKILRSAFTARSLRFNLWEIGVFSNRWSLIAAVITIGIAFAAIYILPVGMNTAAMVLFPTLFLLGLIPPIVEEAVKFGRKFFVKPLVVTVVPAPAQKA